MDTSEMVYSQSGTFKLIPIIFKRESIEKIVDFLQHISAHHTQTTLSLSGTAWNFFGKGSTRVLHLVSDTS